MLFARVAARRRAHETEGPELARDFGTPGVPAYLANLTNSDGGERVQIDRPTVLPGEAEKSEPAGNVDQIGSQQISLEELQRLQQSGGHVILLDVRTDRSIEGSDVQAKGAVRLPPEQVVQQARELKLPKDAWLIAYCA